MVGIEICRLGRSCLGSGGRSKSSVMEIIGVALLLKVILKRVLLNSSVWLGEKVRIFHAGILCEYLKLYK